MKPILLLFCINILFSLNLFSQTPGLNSTGISDSSALKLINRQQRFFVSIHSGYAIALGSTFKFYPDDVTTVNVRQINNSDPIAKTRYESSSKGLGEGFRYGAGISYILNDFINLGFEFDFFNSTIYKERDSTFTHIQRNNSRGILINDYTYNQNYKISYDATLLTFSPTITFKAISRPKFYIYNKLGVVITYRPNSVQENTVQETVHSVNGNNIFDSSSSSYTRYEWGIKKPAFGFMASVGAQVKLSEQVRGFAELQFSHVVFSVQKRTITDYTVNNEDLISTLPESVRVIEFKNSFLLNPRNSSPDQPSFSVVQRIPITYLCLQLGLAYRF